MGMAIVHRIRPRFRRLQWRFSLSYMLVTVLSVLTLPTFYFTASYIVAIRSPDLPRQMAAGLQGYSQVAAQYLEQTPANRAGLQTWLVDFNSNGRVQSRGGLADLWMSGPRGGDNLCPRDAGGRAAHAAADGASAAGAERRPGG
jgi:hypothetical protein